MFFELLFGILLILGMFLILRIFVVWAVTCFWRAACRLGRWLDYHRPVTFGKHGKFAEKDKLIRRLQREIEALQTQLDFNLAGGIRKRGKQYNFFGLPELENGNGRWMSPVPFYYSNGKVEMRSYSAVDIQKRNSGLVHVQEEKSRRKGWIDEKSIVSEKQTRKGNMVTWRAGEATFYGYEVEPEYKVVEIVHPVERMAEHETKLVRQKDLFVDEVAV